MELYRRPANLFVAGFIGSPAMNFFEATIAGGAAQATNGLRFPFVAERQLVDGHKVVVGVRPEHFASGDGAMEGEVTFVEPTGGQTFVTLDLAGHQTMVLVSSDEDIFAGNRLSVSAPLERTYVFDAETGVRLSAN